MQALKREMYRWLAQRIGLTIYVQWGADVFKHYALTWRGALEWAACYPCDARITMLDWRPLGDLVATRGA